MVPENDKQIKKPLATLKTRKTQTNELINEKTDFTIDNNEIHRIIKTYFEHGCNKI